MQLLLQIKINKSTFWEISSTLEQNEKKIVILKSWVYPINDPCIDALI